MGKRPACLSPEKPFSRSVSQFSPSVMSNSLQLHGLQHNRTPCPSPAPKACSNSCSSHWWCHPTISSSVVSFSSCLQSLPASGSFQISQFFTSGDQSIGDSASPSVFPMNIQDWFPLGLLVGSPCSQRDYQEATFRTRHRTTDWLKIGKGLWQGFILSSCLFNLYVEYIMRNAELDKSQVRNKIARRNINNLRYADNITLMVESKEELKSPWWGWKKKVKKLAWKSTFTKWRSWHPVPSLHGK